MQGGNFHLKVGGGGPKAVAMLVTLCWGLQSVVDIITQTTRWEVVKNSASPKRPFFFRISCHFSHFQSISSPNPRQFHIICMPPLDTPMFINIIILQIFN